MSLEICTVFSSGGFEWSLSRAFRSDYSPPAQPRLTWSVKLPSLRPIRPSAEGRRADHDQYVIDSLVTSKSWSDLDRVQDCFY